MIGAYGVLSGYYATVDISFEMFSQNAYQNEGSAQVGYATITQSSKMKNCACCIYKISLSWGPTTEAHYAKSKENISRSLLFAPCSRIGGHGDVKKGILLISSNLGE